MPPPVLPNQSEVYGPYSAPLAFTRATLSPPVAVDAAYQLDTQMLSVSFQGAPGAASFELSVRDATGTVKLVGSGPASPIAVNAHELVADTPYAVLVRGLATGINGAWSSPVDLTIKTLTAPTVTAVTNDVDTITVTFSPITGANQYTAEVLDSDLKPLVPPVVAQGAASPIAIPAAGLTSGVTYNVKVRADLLNPPPGT